MSIRESRITGARITGALKRATSLAALVAVLGTAGSGAHAFTSIKAFGDSYVDTGNLWTLLPPGAQLPLYPTGRFSGGFNYVDVLSALLGVQQFNFAFGGAKTGADNTVAPGLPGFAQEWGAFLGAGGYFMPSDLLVLNIGGNDARAYYQGGGTLGGVGAAASTSAAQAMAGVGALVGTGARNIVFTVGDVGALPEATGNPAAPIGTSFSQSYNLMMQAQLGALTAATGVRVEYVDIGLLGAQIRANPSLYGIANAGACPIACIGDPALQAKYLFYVDGIHLTSAGFALMARYIENRLNAPMTLPLQGDAGMIATSSFMSNMLGRLDLFNAQSAVSARLMSYADQGRDAGPFAKSPAAPAASPLSVYINIDGGLGSRRATAAANGYNWESVGGTIGLDYRLAGNAVVGAAFNYSNPSLRQDRGAGGTDVNAYQFGLYGAWNGANLFAQGAMSFGITSYKNWRPGVVSTISSSANGWTLSVAAKAGYLFDLTDRLRLGPIAGLNYASAQVDGYSESGDAVLTLSVGRQKVETLIGSAGAQARYRFAMGAREVTTYLNFVAEEDFHGTGRAFAYSATSAPLIVNKWTVPTTPRDLYGRVSAGAATDVAPGVSVSLNLSQTFARRGGDDFTGRGGLKFSF